MHLNITEAIKNKSKTHPSASDAVLIVEDEKGKYILINISYNSL